MSKPTSPSSSKAAEQRSLGQRQPERAAQAREREAGEKAAATSSSDGRAKAKTVCGALESKKREGESGARGGAGERRYVCQGWDGRADGFRADPAKGPPAKDEGHSKREETQGRAKEEWGGKER